MAQSVKKRMSKAMPSRFKKSRKSQIKFAKRILENHKVLEQVKNQLN